MEYEEEEEMCFPFQDLEEIQPNIVKRPLCLRCK